MKTISTSSRAKAFVLANYGDGQEFTAQDVYNGLGADPADRGGCTAFCSNALARGVLTLVRSDMRHYVYRVTDRESLDGYAVSDRPGSSVGSAGGPQKRHRVPASKEQLAEQLLSIAGQIEKLDTGTKLSDIPTADLLAELIRREKRK